jgi:hypothetical protein
MGKEIETFRDAGECEISRFCGPYNGAFLKRLHSFSEQNIVGGGLGSAVGQRQAYSLKVLHHMPSRW